MKQTFETTRAARNLHPYVSPKKDWDDYAEDMRSTPAVEVLVEKAPSSRRELRKRQRDLTAMGKKSRRKADRLAFAEKQNEQNLRGMARVQIGGRGNPEMFRNVERATCRFVEQLAKDKGIEMGEARAEVEGMLFTVAEAYGDLEDAV